jgi:ribulose kinase
MFGHGVSIPVNEEEAAIGAAITGGVAAGVFKSFEEGKKAITYIDEGE